MHQPPKILIVDDTPLNVDLLEQALDELGYQTVTAAHGQAALAQIAATQPDLMLLDIMMPVMDGYQVLTHLKADPQLRDLPVIVISALSDMESIVRGIALGAEDFLPKPFDPVLLQARLSASLEKKRLRDLEKQFRRALERELEIGRDIQASFLPARLPEPQGWELAARFMAQRQVAGDFYDAFYAPDASRLCVVIGDVSGKGVGAALYMTLFRTLLRVLIQRGNETVGGDDASVLIRAVDFTNTYVSQTHGESNMFATIFVGLIDLTNGTLTYVNAGHNPPMLLSQGRVRDVLARTGMVVGLRAASWVAAQAQLAPGETLLLYTDGVTEAFNAEAQDYGEARLEQVAAGAALSADALVQHVAQDVFQFIGAAEQADDLTILAVRRADAQES